jgi:putative heme-binding domain-containing protein
MQSEKASTAMLDVALKGDAALKEMAVWWLLHNQQGVWAEHGLEPKLKSTGVYDPDKIQLVSSEPPPIPENAPTLPSPAELAQIPGDAVRGQAAGSVCFMCHRIGGTGVEFGPDLSSFAAQQTKEVIAQAISMPSADISHGYEGSVIKTKDGKTIHGIVVATGDPVMIQCVGGMIQTVPKSKIASLSPAKEHSLMYEPSQLGLDAQKIADIIAWLKSLPSNVSTR